MGPANFLHNVALDAKQCAMTAETISYDYALSTDACKRFMDNGLKTNDMLDDEYKEEVRENKPSLLFQIRDDFNTMSESARRMKHLSQQ